LNFLGYLHEIVRVVQVGHVLVVAVRIVKAFLLTLFVT
jgi:hypothetical protein